jgi:hypothetical protein
MPAANTFTSVTGRKKMTDLVIRLCAWERVFPCDEGKPEGSLYLEAADRIEELTKVLEEVDAWVDGLAPYADFEAEPAPVFKKVKAVLGRGYK